MEKLVLTDYAGQRCDVILTVLDGGYRYVRFTFEPGYGYPSLSVEELEVLVSKLKAMSGAMGNGGWET